MNRTWHLSPPEVLEQLEASLRALRVDAIGLYPFHSGSDEAFRQPELWTLLESQKRAGMIRHLGISTASKGGPLRAEEARRVGAGILQVVSSRLERRAEQDFVPHARKQDLGVLARVPLASGFLSAKSSTTGSLPANDFRSTLDEAKVRQWLHEVEVIRRTELP